MNGTECMTDNPTFTAKELCSIMKEARKCGVTSLSIGTFHVEFGPALSQEQPSLVSATAIAAENQKHEPVEQVAIARDEQTIREDELANMLLENPVEFEALIARGELDDE